MKLHNPKEDGGYLMFLLKYFQRKKENNYIKIVRTEKHGEIGLAAINGDLRDKIIEKFKETYLVQGDHINTGGKASPIPLLTLLAGGGGALGATGLTSGTLFMATANPATLMPIGGGVGSAVMGASGIVGQAPFIMLSGALMPVVAPLLAFQCLTTIVILRQFKQVSERLATLEKKMDRVLQRQEAIFIGEVFSASSRIKRLEEEFHLCNQFTNDMVIRLALLEDNVNPIFERYAYLYERQMIDENLSRDDLEYKKRDAHMSIILSIIDLGIDSLRLRLTLQENPGYIKHCAESMVGKVERYKSHWLEIENSPLRVNEIARDLRNSIEEMSWWQKNVPRWLRGKKDEKKEMEKQRDGLLVGASDKATHDLKDMTTDATKVADEAISQIESINTTSLIYWQDELGKHSYYTSDLVLKKQP